MRRGDSLFSKVEQTKVFLELIKRYWLLMVSFSQFVLLSCFVTTVEQSGKREMGCKTLTCILKLKFHVHLSLKVMGSWLAWGDGGSLKVNSVLHLVRQGAILVEKKCERNISMKLNQESFCRVEPGNKIGQKQFLSLKPLSTQNHQPLRFKIPTDFSLMC